MQTEKIVAQTRTDLAESAAERREAAETEVSSWGLTLEGALIAASEATNAYIADPSLERGATMEARYPGTTWPGRSQRGEDDDDDHRVFRHLLHDVTLGGDTP